MADGAEEKIKTAAELDEELDKYLDKLMAKKKSKYKDGLTEENWEQELENIPFFRSKPLEDGEEVSPEVAALQALKFEDQNPTAKAEAFKDEGNYEYKKKNFRKAIIAYTEGIRAKCDDNNLNAILYTNRATVNFTIGNHRSALKDALQARKLNPTYMKAVVRGASSSFNCKLYEHSIRWCDDGLKIEPDNTKLQSLRKDAIKEQKNHERDKRKAKQVRKKMYEERFAIIEEIKKRNIRCYQASQTQVEDDDDFDDDIDEEELILKKRFSEIDLGPYHPSGAIVQIDENHKLYWPVLFVYPEYQQSDFIAAFCEDHCFMDHFDVMFGNDSAPWDDELKYEPYKLECYFEDQERGCLVSVHSSTTLKEVLSDRRYIVRHGTPSFLIVVQNSQFRAELLKKYSKSE